MKKIICVFAVLLIANFSFGQTVAVQPVEKEVEDITRSGMAVNIELDKKFVEKQWKKTLKEFGGKMTTSHGIMIIDGATISEVSSSPIRIMTMVEGGKGTTQVWWILDLGTEFVTSKSGSWGSAKKIMHDFGVVCYREDINVQIEEVEKEFERTVKHLEKEEKEGVTIKEKIETNKSTITKLTEENVNLEKEKEQNVKSQEQLKKDVETMKQKVAATKAKLDKVR